jgi:hypothetical protein
VTTVLLVRQIHTTIPTSKYTLFAHPSSLDYNCIVFHLGMVHITIKTQTVRRIITMDEVVQHTHLVMAMFTRNETIYLWSWVSVNLQKWIGVKLITVFIIMRIFMQPIVINKVNAEVVELQASDEE